MFQITSTRGREEEFRQKVEINYKGELQLRGFWKRISEGRRSMYSVLMLISIFGGLLGLKKSSIGVMIFMLVLFVGGILFSYISWSREDAQRLEKELDKIKDTLNNEIKRIVDNQQREVQNRINKYLSVVEQEVLDSLEEVIYTSQNEQRQSSEEKTQALRAKLNNVEKQKRELERLERDLTNLNNEKRTFVSSLEQFFEKTFRQHCKPGDT